MRFTTRLLLSVGLLSGAAAWACAEESPPVVAEIRAAAAAPTIGPEGRPLPLAGHWNRGTRPEGFSPDYQLELIRRGHHLLPWFEFPRPGAPTDDAYFTRYDAAFKQVAEWKLPFTLVGTQWEIVLAKKSLFGQTFPFKDLPPDQSALALNDDGEPDPRLGISPFGAIEPWREVGRLWVDSPMIRRLQEVYPDPPRVIFLSNNEAPKIRWAKNGGVERDKRFTDQYGFDCTDEMKRCLVGNGWIVRYRAMFEAMRSHLDASGWRDQVRFVGYGAFGPDHMGRWSGWPVYSLHCGNRFDWAPYAWDGASPSYYTHDWDASTDFTVHSPLVSFMNYVMAQRRVYADKPDFWFEFSVWDGSKTDAQGREIGKPAWYAKHGEPYSPVRHASYVEFGMWLTRPRVVREFRGYLDTRERVGAYFEAIVEVVDRVYADPVLREFWRFGELVPNRGHRHPFQVAIPEEFAAEDRWYMLDTNLDPPRPWSLDTELPVQSLALVLNEPQNRRWLVYARSPLADRKDVTIRIPDGPEITVDVPIAGAFYLVDAKTGSPQRVGR
ncbi:hypothetical protein JCM19992_03780 [Thermostilla marina]